MATIVGGNFVWGVCDPLPLRGFPLGKTRIRMRNDEFVSVFVKTGSSIRAFIVKEEGGFWTPGPEISANHRPQITK